ncbi:hypothetical protein [Cupriavidus nantongensis]|uniref:hypothetical protein n=1 Tax=Cupriavidus nantongensis TaxID=1796606 RepID=UPI001E2E4F26|nr:hypothetical protein [Cupriavidus nantongensis]
MPVGSSSGQTRGLKILEEEAVNTGTPFSVFAMRYLPIRDQRLNILARNRNAWRTTRAEQRFDVEGLIRACVPDAATCDPRIVADAIREWFDSFDDGIPAWRLSPQEQ